MKYTTITDICFYNSQMTSKESLIKYFNEGLFSTEKLWDDFKLVNEIPGFMDSIASRVKYSMSKLSLGIYNALDKGPFKDKLTDEELYFFSGFTEIETVSKIGNSLINDNFNINPGLFPNSVNHVALSHFTILKKLTSYCAAISDGVFNNYSFISFIKNRVKLETSFVVTAGEEASKFYEYDSEKLLDMTPSYIAFRVIPKTEKGFIFAGEFDDISEIMKTDFYKQSKNVFLDKASFLQLKKLDNTKNIYTDYPISRDNPEGIINRLALPFYLELKGDNLIVEKIMNKYYIFSIKL